MLYTVQIPVVFTLVVESEDPEMAAEAAAAVLVDSEITMSQEYVMEEMWEDVEVYDEAGNYASGYVEE